MSKMPVYTPLGHTEIENLIKQSIAEEQAIVESIMNTDAISTGIYIGRISAFGAVLEWITKGIIKEETDAEQTLLLR